jgi:paraquat-inducible protein A
MQDMEHQKVKSDIILIRVLLVVSAVLFVIGLFAPMLTMSKFYFFENSFSIVGGISSLFQEGQFLIALVVTVFSLVLPVAKIAFLFRVSFSRLGETIKHKRFLSLMHEYGRWAMLDVFVVAVLIMTVKLGAVASIEVHWGLYVFAAAVILIMYLTHKVTKLFDVYTG